MWVANVRNATRASGGRRASLSSSTTLTKSDDRDSLRRHQTEFGEMSAKRVRQHRSLPDEQIACPVQHQYRLLLGAVDRHEAMLGRCIASQIASASAASFLPRLT
jgi:hypothetical protein